MTGGGFYERKTMSPGSLAVVVGLHAAALTAVALTKPTIFQLPDDGPLIVTQIPITPDPPPVPPPPTPRIDTPQPPPVSRLDTPPTVIDLPVPQPPVTGRPVPPPPIPSETIGAGSSAGFVGTPQLPPMRIEAQFDPRFADQVQPPYPPSEQRAQREGTVRVQVTIGADGRVKAVRRLSATSDAFWRATERHALSRWRFRPATEDGRPVESTKVLALTFQIEA